MCVCVCCVRLPPPNLTPHPRKIAPPLHTHTRTYTHTHTHTHTRVCARRVQAHAAAAVVNFSEGAEADLMAPHLDALITKLLTLLQRGKKLVQVGACARVCVRVCVCVCV